jgi:hypothetical protein
MQYAVLLTSSNTMLLHNTHQQLQLPQGVKSKIPEGAVAEHTAKVTGALTSLTGSATSTLTSALGGSATAGGAPKSDTPPATEPKSEPAGSVVSATTTTTTVASGEVAANDTSATAELLRQLGPGSAAVTTEITTQLTNVAEKVRM